MINWSFGKFHLEDLEQFQLGAGHCYNRHWESHSLCYNHTESCGHVRFLIVQETSTPKDLSNSTVVASIRPALCSPIKRYSCC